MFPRELILEICRYHRVTLMALRCTSSEFRHTRGGKWCIKKAVYQQGFRTTPVLLAGTRHKTIFMPMNIVSCSFEVDDVRRYYRDRKEGFRGIVRELYLLERDIMIVYKQYFAYVDHDIKQMCANDTFTYVPLLMLLVNGDADISLIAEYAPKYGEDNQFRGSHIQVGHYAHVDVVAATLGLDFCGNVSAPA